MGDSVDDKKAQRFRFLNALYGKTDGDEHAQVQMFDLGKELGLSTNVTERAVQYLVGEDLMEHAAMGGYVAITHYGVVGCVATSGLRRQDGPPLASTVPGPPSCPATIRSNGASSNPPSSSRAFGGTCGMP